MQQLTQQLKTGVTKILEVPIPQVSASQVLVRNHWSLISAGTEGSTVKAARKSLIGKAKERPQQVKQVVDVLKTQGPVQTYRAVMKKLEAYSPLGYSTAGEVVEVGDGVTGFRVGDYVACAGLTANHSEFIPVPVNLCVKLERDANLGLAAYNTLGAIALQGVRQADLRLGESCAVIGLGLLGQLTCLMLRASGVKAFGVDVSEAAVQTAREHAVDDAWTRDTPGLSGLINQKTDGLGVDAVIITAATSSDDPINFSGEIARKRGRIVVVGAVPTGFERDPHWYRKELELRMSCSYGPGRYDPEYEEKGHDYPAAYVRWTEKRNMQAFQEMLQSNRINLDYLTTHRFKLDEAGKAYDMILERSEPFLGILIEYDTTKEIDRSPILTSALSDTSNSHSASARIGVSFIGAGSYAQSNLLPNLPSDIDRMSVLTNSGTTSKRVADKFEFAKSVSCVDDILTDNSTNVVFIATRHDTHGKYVKAALRSGKNVFVEKPVCLSKVELDEIAELLAESTQQSEAGRRSKRETEELGHPSHLTGQLMVGYNRRFSPHAIRLKSAFSEGPKAITYRVNAGAIPGDSWIQDREIGGGRLIGEGCHFIDFITWFCDSLPVRVYASAIPDPSHHLDTISVQLEMADGSIGTVHYFASGSKSQAKEYVEVHQSGVSGVLNDYRETTVYTGGKPRVERSRSQDKGQSAMMNAFFQSIKAGGSSLLPVAQMYSVMDACFAAERSVIERNVIPIGTIGASIE